MQLRDYKHHFFYLGYPSSRFRMAMRMTTFVVVCLQLTICLQLSKFIWWPILRCCLYKADDCLFRNARLCCTLTKIRRSIWPMYSSLPSYVFASLYAIFMLCCAGFIYHLMSFLILSLTPFTLGSGNLTLNTIYRNSKRNFIS